MKKHTKIIYIKLLYLATADLLLFKKELLVFKFKMKLLSKKELNKLFMSTSINTCVLYSVENNNVEMIKRMLHVANNFDFLQVLGIVENNILVPFYEEEINKLCVVKFRNNFLFKIVCLQNMFLKNINNTSTCQ